MSLKGSWENCGLRQCSRLQQEREKGRGKGVQGGQGGASPPPPPSLERVFPGARYGGSSPGQGEVRAGALQSAQALLQAFGEDRIGALAGLGLEGGESDALAQAALRRGQGRQGFVGGVPVAIGVAMISWTEGIA